MDRERLNSMLPIVLGTGMNGCECLLSLATLGTFSGASGIRKIVIIDYDSLSTSDLGKTIFPQSDAFSHRLKVDSLKDMVKAINTEVEIESFSSDFSKLPKGRLADIISHHTDREQQIIPIITVDNRRTIIHATTFFGLLGLKSYIGILTAPSLLSEVYVMNPADGGCFGCSFSEKELEILDESTGCSGAHAQEKAAPAIRSVAAQTAALLMHEIFRNTMPGLNPPSSKSYSMSYSPIEGSLFSEIPRSNKCKFHFNKTSGILEMPGRAILKDVFVRMGEKLGIPSQRVEMDFLLQNKHLNLSVICPGCGSKVPFGILDIVTKVCPACKIESSIWVPDEKKRNIKLCDLDERSKDFSLDALGIPDDDLVICQALDHRKKTVFLRKKGR
jgi:molybdopterin/thiamine biosynthesis adenylyltransferase